MNYFVIELLNILLVVFETAMLVIIASGFFRQKKSSKTIYLYAVPFIAIEYIILMLIGEYAILKPVVALLLLSTFMRLCFHAEILKCIFSVMFLLAYLTGADNAFLLFITATTELSVQALMQNPYSYYILCFGIKSLELFGIVILHTWAKSKFKNQVSTWADWLRILFLPLASLAISIYLIRIYQLAPEFAAEFLICTTILLVADLMSVFLVNYIEQQQNAVRDNAILKHSIKQERDNIEAWKNAYSGQRKLTHDFHNQLSVIKGMIEKSTSKDEILCYMERLTNNTQLSAHFVNTHRSVVDIILNQKYAIALNKNIKMYAYLDDLSGFPMSDDDLVIVLSNLVDNALEECERISLHDRKYVLLKMKMENQAAFLHIENPTNSSVVIKNNQIIGSKKNSIDHGFGLKNIVTILERYEAIYALDWREKDSVFSFSIQFDI